LQLAAVRTHLRGADLFRQSGRCCSLSRTHQTWRSPVPA
jgi:hypothetical protein